MEADILTATTQPIVRDFDTSSSQILCYIPYFPIKSDKPLESHVYGHISRDFRELGA